MSVKAPPYLQHVRPESSSAHTAEDFLRYRQYRIRTFLLTWCAYVSLYLCRKNLSVVKKHLAKSHRLSTSQLGNIDTGYLVAYALGQFISGSAGDRIGAKRLIIIGLLATALLNIGFGMGGQAFFFLIIWTLNGFAQSTGWPGCTKTVSRWFARDERGTIMGFWCTCYQVGPVLSTVVATWLLSHWGWSFAFYGPAMLLFFFALFYFFLQPSSPENEHLPSAEVYYQALRGSRAMVTEQGVNGEQRGQPRDNSSPEEKPSSLLVNIQYVINNRPIWTLGLTYVVLKFIRYTFLFWLPFFMASQLGYTASRAGYSSVAFDVAGILGAVFAGVVSDRFFQSRRAPIIVMMMSLLALAIFAYPTLSAMGRWSNLIGMACIGFLLYGPDTVASGVAAVDFGQRRAAALAVGFVNGLGSIGGALSGILVGRISESHGWDMIFFLSAPLCLLGALLMATLWHRIPGETSSVATRKKT